MRTRALCAIGFSLFFLGQGCAKEGPPKPAVSPAGGSSGEAQPQVISTFNLVGHTPTGRKKWEIQGETADLTAELVTLSPVTATNFGKVDVVLVANRGWFHRESRDIELEGDVIATTSDGARLTTDTFQWNGQRETGVTRDWVTVTRPGMTILGKGGITFPRIKRVRLEREVTVTLQGEKEKTFITCDGPMQVDYGSKKARFWRNVRVRDAQGFLRSDRMDVRFHPSRNEVTQVRCWGHVEIYDRQKQRSAFSDRAQSWRDIGRTLLFGHPKLAMVSTDDQR